MKKLIAVILLISCLVSTGCLGIVKQILRGEKEDRSIKQPKEEVSKKQ